jgi:hypothetical protein
MPLAHALNSLWDSIKSTANQDAAKYLCVAIPKARTDLDYDDQPLKADQHYLRLWLSEMFLSQRRAWFKDWFPAVHASVRLKFANREATFSNVARPPQNGVGQGVLLNYRLTDLLPFNGGVVEVEAALLGLQGTNHLQATVGLLSSFASLITPPLGQTLAVAEKVANGMEELFSATNGAVHLPYHQSFTAAGGVGASPLRPGYVAVILATAQEIDVAQLSVKEGRLYHAEGGAAPAPLTGVDYLLLQIEARTERDDWRLSNIQEPLDKAKEALIQGEEEKADAFKRVALLNAWQSPDLVNADRRRVVQAIKDELKAIEAEGRGAAPGEERDLTRMMAVRAMPTARAASLGKMRFEELFD